MWIVVSIPLMLLACAIAIVPVLHGSIVHHRSELAGNQGVPEKKENGVEVVCPPCGARLRAADSEELLAETRRHAWRVHGVPHPEHVLAAAISAEPASA